MRFVRRMLPVLLFRTDEMLDELDRNLLKRCAEKSGSNLIDILEPFLEVRAKRTLYERLERLEAAGYIRIDRETLRGSVFCHVTDKGKDALGRTSRPDQEV